MNRISRTVTLSAAAVLALGIAACSPTNQKNSDAPQVTTVSPDSGYEGAGQAETSSTDDAEAAAETTDAVTEGTGTATGATTDYLEDGSDTTTQDSVAQ